MATIKDVAKAAGVSTATVSAVINDSAYVSPDLRTRVLGAGLEAGSLLRLDLRHQPGSPGLLGVGAGLAEADLTLGDEAEGVRIDAGPELALGRIALAFARDANARADVELTRPTGRPWKKRI